MRDSTDLDIIFQYVANNENPNWDLIGLQLKEKKSGEIVKSLYESFLKKKIKKRWNENEIKLLKDIIEKNEFIDFLNILLFFPGRTEKSIRKQVYNLKNPNKEKTV